MLTEELAICSAVHMKLRTWNFFFSLFSFSFPWPFPFLRACHKAEMHRILSAKCYSFPFSITSLFCPPRPAHPQHSFMASPCPPSTGPLWLSQTEPGLLHIVISGKRYILLYSPDVPNSPLSWWHYLTANRRKKENSARTLLVLNSENR